MSNKKGLSKPSWLNEVLNKEKIEVEPFTKTEEETKGKNDIYHYAEQRTWNNENKQELSKPFSFRLRSDLEILIKNHTVGSKNQVINDLIEIGFKELEKKFKN